jgi:hypothetical protein
MHASKLMALIALGSAAIIGGIELTPALRARLPAAWFSHFSLHGEILYHPLRGMPALYVRLKT